MAAIAALCNEHRVPLVPRGAGTGYTGGAVPLRGGVVLSMERFNRIIEIDEDNLLAIVQPHVITGVLQEAVERAACSILPIRVARTLDDRRQHRRMRRRSARVQIRHDEALHPRPGSGAADRRDRPHRRQVRQERRRLRPHAADRRIEGTLAIVTEAIVRLVPRPPAHATLRTTFASIADAVRAVSAIVRARVVPVALELMDRVTLAALEAHLGERLAPAGTEALLIVEVDGFEAAVREEIAAVAAACQATGATDLRVAKDEIERQEIWRLRRELSYSLMTVASVKFNHDVVVPKGRIPELFELVERLRAKYGIHIPSFGHVGDGNIHVNIMVNREDVAMMARVPRPNANCSKAWSRSKVRSPANTASAFRRRYMPLELSAETIALMRPRQARVRSERHSQSGQDLPRRDCQLTGY